MLFLKILKVLRLFISIIIQNYSKAALKRGAPMSELTTRLFNLFFLIIFFIVSSRFYTIIPTVVGMKRLPVINTFLSLEKKMKLIEALIDIEVAQSIIKTVGDNVGLFFNCILRIFLST
jgi:hypothetical protein